MRPVENSIYGIYESFGVTLINRLLLSFIYYDNVSLDTILPMLWTRYSHALLQIEIHSISFYVAKTT